MKAQAEAMLGFLGAGRMAAALAGGVVRAGEWPAEQVVGWDVSAEALARFKKATGAGVAESADAMAQRCGVIVLAVKPQQAGEALGALGRRLEGKLVISIAAGVTLSRLEMLAPSTARVVRVMPNTPALVGAGASAYCLGSRATEADGATAERLLGAAGLVVRVPEHQLDAVTGLSGSGPAYLCLVIEALADGGVAAGLPRQLALRLAAQTVMGTGRLVAESGEHPARLKDDVASPAGTTVEGLKVLESRGVRSAFIDAVVAAFRRSKELGQG